FLKGLGFDKGLIHKLQWNNKNWSVLDWIKYGSEREDSYIILDYLPIWDLRSDNHFHKATVQKENWGEAGLNDMRRGESSILWAQDFYGTQSRYTEGNWSWQRTRDYYYKALTSQSDTEWQGNFARTFKGLGHQMHLVQDVAVPAHARNDAHPRESILIINKMGNLGLETWADEEENEEYIKQYASNPRRPVVDLNVHFSYGGKELVPIAQLIDSDYYDGTNPDISLIGGIAEYANANFFSENTIFATEKYKKGHRHYFPYPRRSSTDIDDYENGVKIPEISVAEDGGMDITLYLTKDKDGEKGYRLVRGSYFTREIFKIRKKRYLYDSTFYLDDRCHEDYAKFLIPRAVGYSVALIDYFFRGRLEIAEKQSILNGNGDIKGLFLTLKNRTTLNDTVVTAGQDMTGGHLVISYRYRDPESKGYLYGLSDKIEDISIPYDGTKSFDFTFSKPIPSNAQDLMMMLVYRGRLGTEEDAVIGRVIETTPTYCVMVQTGLDWTKGQPAPDPYCKTDSAHFTIYGEFKYLQPGGKEVSPSENRELKVHYHSGLLQGRFFVNDIEITDSVWTYQNWFNATGIPVKWKVEVTEGFHIADKIKDIHYFRFFPLEGYEIVIEPFQISCRSGCHEGHLHEITARDLISVYPKCSSCDEFCCSADLWQDRDEFAISSDYIFNEDLFSWNQIDGEYYTETMSLHGWANKCYPQCGGGECMPFWSEEKFRYLWIIPETNITNVSSSNYTKYSNPPHWSHTGYCSYRSDKLINWRDYMCYPKKCNPPEICEDWIPYSRYEDVKWHGELEIFFDPKPAHALYKFLEKFGLSIQPIKMEFKLSLTGCNPAVIYGNCP
ncbi:MAG: hypothetical protein QXH17_08375, partial [Candidatus Bathyarchaeia archaeon]